MLSIFNNEPAYIIVQNCLLSFHKVGLGFVGWGLRYDTIRLTTLTCAQKLTSSQLNLPHGNQTKKNNEETKPQKTEMLIRNGSVVKSVESVLMLKGSLWWERFVKEVGLEAGVKERGSYGW